MPTPQASKRRCSVSTSSGTVVAPRMGQPEQPFEFVRPPWHPDAACRGQDPNLFFPTHGKHGQTNAVALALCADCPVREPCLRFALEQPEATDIGIWGGTTRLQRKRLRRELRMVKRPRKVICRECSGLYETTNPSARFCSVRCRQRSYDRHSRAARAKRKAKKVQ